MTQPLQLSTADDREEIARAEVYGLLSQLFYAAPDAELHSQLQVAPTEAPARGAWLESSWSELVAASRRLSRDAVADEFDALFVSIGKPEIFLYASHHIAGALNEKPLVTLRDTLRQLGLERAETMAETEDHLTYLCEVMRFLIAGDDLAVSNLTAQQRFFNEHLRSWAGGLWEQIAAHPRADFYRALARFAAEFFAVEEQAFDMLD
ncbi:MAG TPA: molecular chaperone TorD family protein [Albitalea sp.]|nr:molecular chaperone TorD family protein [Albitalea sp.]